MTPVLVVWGPGRPTLAGGKATLEGGVVLLDGNGCSRYFKSLARGRIDSEDVDTAHRALDTFVRERRSYDRATSRSHVDRGPGGPAP